MMDATVIFNDADEDGELEVYQSSRGGRIHFEVSQVTGVDHLIQGGYGDEYHRKAVWSMAQDEFIGFIEESLEYFARSRGK